MKSINIKNVEIKSKILDIGIENKINYEKFIEILEEMTNECKMIQIITDNIIGDTKKWN